MSLSTTERLYPARGFRAVCALAEGHDEEVEAEKKLEQSAPVANGSGGKAGLALLADDSVTFT